MHITEYTQIVIFSYSFYFFIISIEMHIFSFFSSIDYCTVTLNHIIWCICVSVHWSEAFLLRSAALNRSITLCLNRNGFGGMKPGSNGCYLPV